MVNHLLHLTLILTAFRVATTFCGDTNYCHLPFKILKFNFGKWSPSAVQIRLRSNLSVCFNLDGRTRNCYR